MESSLRKLPVFKNGGGLREFKGGFPYKFNTVLCSSIQISLLAKKDIQVNRQDWTQNPETDAT